MNAIIQVGIGILILGAAFFFGNQLRLRQVNTETIEANSHQAEPGFVWQKPPYEPKQVVPQETSGLVDLPVAKKRTPSAPNPKVLSLPAPPTTSQTKKLATTTREPEEPVAITGSSPQEPLVKNAIEPVVNHSQEPVVENAIVEPDFSQLASSFMKSVRETPIAESIQKTTIADSTSESVSPPSVLRNVTPPLRTQFDATKLTKIDPATRPTVTIPQSSLLYFEPDDFEPRLKDPTTGARSHVSQMIETLPVRHPEPQGVQKIPIVDVDNSEIQRNRRRPLVPFGLNDAAKSRMVEVRSRQANPLRLETNRFFRHQTKSGETLQYVSRKYYGKPDYYLDIYLANQDVLRNPGLVPAGTSLKIPIYD